jgi:hypothetical protein
LSPPGHKAQQAQPQSTHQQHPHHHHLHHHHHNLHVDAPWSTKGAIILDADHQNATEWSSYVKPIIKYHKASLLLTAAPTADQDKLVAQMILFLTQTSHHTLHSVIVDDDPKSTWEAIQALKPNNATRLEQLANEITSLTLSDTTASEYVSAHRAANTTFLSIDSTHHYSNPQTYLQRFSQASNLHLI